MTAKPFTDVEMMLLSKLVYGDFSSQYFDSNGLAKKEITLAEALRDNPIFTSLKKEYDKDVVDSFITKAHQVKIVKAYEEPYVTGFAAIALEGPEKGTVTVAVRGTEMKTVQDWAADIQLGLENETMQQRAMNTFMEDLNSYDSIYLTGHSLGGNLAVSGAVGFEDSKKIKGVATFNAPGQNTVYLASNSKNIKKVEGKITNYQNEGDMVSDINLAVGEVVVVKSRSGDDFDLSDGFQNHDMKDLQYTKDGFKVSKKGKTWYHKLANAGWSGGTAVISTMKTIATYASPYGWYKKYIKNIVLDQVIDSGSKQNTVASERIFMNPEGLRSQASQMLIFESIFADLSQQLRNLVVTLREEHIWDSPATLIFVENYLGLHENFTKFSECLKEYSKLMKDHSISMEGLDDELSSKISSISM